ncbi:MAG: type II toxin-antitoxin system VapC family toxin [Planctomycetota bacterium]
MMGRVFVLDASVAAKWFLQDEPDTIPALALKEEWDAGRLEFHVPAVFHGEACQLLAKACGRRDAATRSPRLSKHEALECIEQLYGWAFHVAELTKERSQAALVLSTLWSKRFYDMTYLALAEELDCRWITADEKVLASSPPGFPAHGVLLLSALALK